MNNMHLVLLDNFEDKFASRIAARLSDSTVSLPNDISERLKAARMQALSMRKVVKLQVASGVSHSGGAATLHIGGDDRSLWNRIASLVPLFALIAGLLTIAVLQDQKRANEIAAVDVELLTDDLPPAAYTDPGFVHFLNMNRRD
jgi:hypothetical protein